MTTLVIGNSRELVVDYLRKISGSSSKVNNMQLTLDVNGKSYRGIVYNTNWKQRLQAVTFSDVVFLDDYYPDQFINYVMSKRRG